MIRIEPLRYTTNILQIWPPFSLLRYILRDKQEKERQSPASYLCSPPGYLFLLLGSLSQPSPPFPLRCLQCLIFLQQLHQQSPVIFSPRDSGCLGIILIHSSELWFSISSKLNLRTFFTEMKKKKKKNGRTRLHNLTIPSGWGNKMIREDSPVLLIHNALGLPW